MLSMFHRLSMGPVRGLRVVKKNSHGGLLGRFASGTVNLPIITKPDRTSSVKGVVLRTGTTKMMDALRRVHGIVSIGIRPSCFSPTSTRI